MQFIRRNRLIILCILLVVVAHITGVLTSDIYPLLQKTF